MNRVIACISTENYRMSLSDTSVDLDSKKYRSLFISKDLTINATDSQLEALFDIIDCKLHPFTYSELEDKVEEYRLDLEEMECKLDQYRENVAMDVLNRG